MGDTFVPGGSRLWRTPSGLGISVDTTPRGRHESAWSTTIAGELPDADYDVELYINDRLIDGHRGRDSLGYRFTDVPVSGVTRA